MDGTLNPNSRSVDQLYSQEAGQYINSYSAEWIDYLFHFTDITNAVGILQNGNLLSRNEAKSNELMQNDNASRQVLRRMNLKYLDYVRFYIRPKTRMQYKVEGIRSADRVDLGAQVPIPVFFLFNPGEILCQPGVLFSDDNLSKNGTKVYEQLEDLNKIPFANVYLQKIAYPEPEILLPSPLRLSHLEMVEIIVRSNAEKTTLLSQLDPKTASQWKSKIRTENEGSLEVFYHNDLYVQDVILDGTYYRIEMNKPKLKKNFEVTLVLEYSNGTSKKEIVPRDWDNFYISKRQGPLQLKKISVYFDNHLGYYNSDVMNLE